MANPDSYRAAIRTYEGNVLRTVAYFNLYLKGFPLSTNINSEYPTIRSEWFNGCFQEKVGLKFGK